MRTGQIEAQEGVNARKCHGNHIDGNGEKRGSGKKQREDNWKLNDIKWKEMEKW